MCPTLQSLYENEQNYIDSLWKIVKSKEDESLYELISYSKRTVVVPHSYYGSLRRVYNPVSDNNISSCSRNLWNPSISQNI